MLINYPFGHSWSNLIATEVTRFPNLHFDLQLLLFLLRNKPNIWMATQENVHANLEWITFMPPQISDKNWTLIKWATTINISQKRKVKKDQFQFPSIFQESKQYTFSASNMLPLCAAEFPEICEVRERC